MATYRANTGSTQALYCPQCGRSICPWSTLRWPRVEDLEQSPGPNRAKAKLAPWRKNAITKLRTMNFLAILSSLYNARASRVAWQNKLMIQHDFIAGSM